MLSKIKSLLSKLKLKDKNKKKDEKEEEYNTFKYYLRELIDILLSSYYTPYLRWWETVIIVITGVLSGVGVGIMIYSLLKYPQTIIVVFQNGSIVRVPVR